MNLAKQLLAAKAVIEDPQHWTHRYYATDDQGIEIDPTNQRACRWCATGAIMKGLPQWSWINSFKESDAAKLLDGVSKYLFSVGLISVNDKIGHEAVMAVYDESIAQAKAAGV